MKKINLGPNPGRVWFALCSVGGGEEESDAYFAHPPSNNGSFEVREIGTVAYISGL